MASHHPDTSEDTAAHQHTPDSHPDQQNIIRANKREVMASTNWEPVIHCMCVSEWVRERKHLTRTGLAAIDGTESAGVWTTALITCCKGHNKIHASYSVNWSRTVRVTNT